MLGDIILNDRVRNHIISECDYKDSGHSGEYFFLSSVRMLCRLIAVGEYSPLEPPTAFWVV